MREICFWSSGISSFLVLAVYTHGKTNHGGEGFPCCEDGVVRCMIFGINSRCLRSAVFNVKSNALRREPCLFPISPEELAPQRTLSVSLLLVEGAFLMFDLFSAKQLTK